ncbi:RNA polymerase sigma factor [Larkinella arboricola]|uniref:RNA polymerase sigma factor (Sigma-70 family) n=1 Tax=Larkinella arboricola TaxID=643671 RepID=A0A327X5C0_LARAB|nr:sigma-70 family RNA polymerase sigma factor [Larkinella arboricola]RAK01931.1 RNA polymerase sigma factor (sigma-70 family) [Larkinella arboricola]
MERITATDYKTLAPQELWQRFKAGDKLAFGALAQVHYRSLYNYGLRLTADSELVWDAIQDLLVDLWDHHQTVGDAVFVKTYLLKSLRYKLLKLLPHHPSLHLDEPAPTQLPYADSIEQQIIDDESHTEQTRLLHQLMASLSKRQQEVLYLRFYQNLDNHEIAQIMGLERQSVANLLHRTFKELRSQWSSSLLLALLVLVRSV